jgi:serine/threonine protein kinase
LNPSQLLDNRYQILHSLAKGGFGETFLAKDTRVPSQRLCVVKQLQLLSHTASVQTLAKERFTREAVVLEELGYHHPQIPQLYAYFEENGQFYLVQEYIQGETLTQRIRHQGPWAESEVRTLLGHLLPVLTYIHDRGIIHRDIKPDNIILRSQDALPVLIDFGAVKEALQTGMAGPGHFAPSVVIGTSGFMPPEQVSGRPVFSSDLYALGLTAIYCLTGQFPYELPDNPMTGELHWQSALPHLSPALTAVLTQATTPALRDRFPTAAAMTEALGKRTFAVATPSPVARPVPPHAPATVSALESDPTQVVSPRQPSQRPQTAYAGQARRPAQPTISTQVAPSSQPQRSERQGGNGILIGVLLVAIATASGLMTTLLLQRRGANSANDNVALDSPASESKPDSQNTPAEPPLETSPTVSEPAAETPVSAEPEASEPEASTPDNPNPEAGTPETPTPAEPAPEPPPETTPLTPDAAQTTVASFYNHVTNQALGQAQALTGGALAQQFDPNFFNQFQQVSVENLRVTTQSAETVELIGKNTYYYPDGSTQEEERTFTVQMVDQEPRIVGSAFVRVIKAR